MPEGCLKGAHEGAHEGAQRSARSAVGAACAALDSNWIGTGVRVPREQRPRVSVVWAQSLMSIDCIRSFFLRL